MKMFRLALAALCATTAAASVQASTIVLGGYPDQIQMVDDVSGKVVQKVALKSGLPTNLQFSADGKRIYVTTLTTGGIEVMDAATRKIISSLSLDTPVTRYRFSGGVPDPSGRYFYIVGTRIDKRSEEHTSELQSLMRISYAVF